MYSGRTGQVDIYVKLALGRWMFMYYGRTGQVDIYVQWSY